MKYVLALLGLLFCGNAYAQDAMVVATCGTLATPYSAGSTRLLTVDTTGKICGTGGGGGGTPGGSNTQVQYNNSGSFGGITGATTNGTALTLVAPVLGTPASGTLTNTTGYLLSNLSGAGTGVLAAAANPVNATTGLATYVLGSSSAFGLVKVDGTTITASAGVISATNSGTVTSIATTCGVSGGTITTTGTISSNAAQRNVTGTTDTITSADCGNVVTESNASPVAVAITTAGFSTGNYFTIKNKGAGLATYTPSSGTINGAATIACAQNQSADLVFDGTNYLALGNTCQLGALATITPGTGVATAAAVSLSAAGGLTSTIASGTSALGTSAISSAACATVVTTAATNTATTDALIASFNGDPTAVTGYVPLTTGMLTIIAYPTSGNVNFKVCNNTGSSITPGAITLNWRVVR